MRVPPFLTDNTGLVSGLTSIVHVHPTNSLNGHLVGPTTGSKDASPYLLTIVGRDFGLDDPRASISLRLDGTRFRMAGGRSETFLDAVSHSIGRSNCDGSAGNECDRLLFALPEGQGVGVQ